LEIIPVMLRAGHGALKVFKYLNGPSGQASYCYVVAVNLPVPPLTDFQGLYTIVNAATRRKLVADTQGFYTDATSDAIPKTHLWRIIGDENSTHLIQNAALGVRDLEFLVSLCLSKKSGYDDGFPQVN